MAGAISSDPEYNARFDLDPVSRHQKIAGLVLNCGVFDLEKAIGLPFRNIELYVQSYCGGKPFDELTEEEKNEISPIYHVTKDFPPTFAISAQYDALAILTFDLVEKLRSLGVEVEHYHGTGKLAVHAFAVVQALRISREAMFGIRAFLRKHTREGLLLRIKPKRKKTDTNKPQK